MGVGDWVRDKITPQFVKDVNTALTPPAATPVEAKTPQQLQYEVKEKAMNRTNPYFQNVDKPVTTEPLTVKGNP